MKRKKIKKVVRSIISLRNQCVDIAKTLAKIRDRYVCVRCGVSKLAGAKIDGSHVKPESHYHDLSAEVTNIKAMCFTCHAWWHLNPTESGAWFREKYPERYEEIHKRALENPIVGRVEWEIRLKILKEKLKKCYRAE